MTLKEEGAKSCLALVHIKNDFLEQNKRIKIGDEIPIGWTRGRKMKYQTI